MCDDGSKHLHETNRIYSSHRIFLGHFYIFVAFWSFFIICENLDFAVLSKQFFYRINNFFVNKSWKDRKYICHKQKKTIRQFGQKSLSVFRGLPWETSKQTKHFFGKCFIIFSAAYEKHIFHNFKIWFTTICWFCLAMCFLTIIHLIECNEGSFLEVNLKTRFFERQNRQSPQK